MKDVRIPNFKAENIYMEMLQTWKYEQITGRWNHVSFYGLYYYHVIICMPMNSIDKPLKFFRYYPIGWDLCKVLKRNEIFPKEGNKRILIIIPDGITLLVTEIEIKLLEKLLYYYTKNLSQTRERKKK